MKVGFVRRAVVQIVSSCSIAANGGFVRRAVIGHVSFGAVAANDCFEPRAAVHRSNFAFHRGEFNKLVE